MDKESFGEERGDIAEVNRQCSSCPGQNLAETGTRKGGGTEYRPEEG
jgi:hypothetical protein